YIVDDNFLYDKQRVEEFCKLLAEHRINKRFLIYGRADFIAAHEDTIATFAAQGLRAVIVGLESANPGELDKYNKHSSVTVNEKALEILAKYNVDCYATLILGIDWDEQDFARLYRWLKKWRLRFINLQPFTPLPGTSQFAQYEHRLIIPRARYEEWDLANLVVKPGKISARRFYYNILKVYFKTTLSFYNTLKHLSYGVIPSLKLSLGVTQITRQYLMKILKG
ncbi:MAG TPA: B12-binding domain-containing radical SAM protein, partial [Verrucomicrobiae bacterium]|nr:B12-binding domain-containing radical SAM protein [Verrucomicrobiae bacterium]